MTDFELDVQQSINTMDIHPNGQLIVAGGRETLKLIELSHEGKQKMNIKYNLRKAGTRMATGYVEFNKYNPDRLVAASVQGTFSIWDVSTHSQLFLEKHHSAAIHRMNWRDQTTLISGGQDCLINYYDTRVNDKQVELIWSNVRHDSIRDVKFNPNDNHYFMAAYESGLLEYYDIRNHQEPVSIKQSAHNNLIICLDWNIQAKNVFASGSNEKEIKIWHIQDNSDIIEKVKIQHIDGSSQIKWHQNNCHQISVSSLNRDVSVTTFDITQPFRPLSIIKGHTDIITSFVYTQDESIIITGSKDKLIRYQSVDLAYKVYENCPKYPVAFNQYDCLVFKLEDCYPVITQSMRKQSSMEEMEQFQKQNIIQSSQSISQYHQNNRQPSTFGYQDKIASSSDKNVKFNEIPFFLGQRNIWNPRTVNIVNDVYELLGIQQESLVNELNYFQENYDSSQSFEYNSEVAARAKKPSVSHYWISLKHIINEFLTLLKEVNGNSVQNVLKNNTVQCLQIQKKQDDLSDDDQKSPIETPLDAKFSPNTFKFKQQEMKKSNSLDHLDLSKLYKYFEKYPSALRQELDSKNIILNEKNHLHIRFERIPYYKSLLRTQTPMNMLLIDKESMLKAMAESIYDLIQHVIDQGELSSGFWMFATAKNYVQFNNQIVEKWTQSYIELLLCFDHFSSTVKVVQECPNDMIKLSNKSISPSVCQRCMQELSEAFCNQCKSEPQCCLCLKPVLGLYLWCQQCNHGGHQAELKEWFKNSKECPTGCGHQCFMNL